MAGRPQFDRLKYPLEKRQVEALDSMLEELFKECNSLRTKVNELSSGGGNGITELTGNVTAGPGSGSQVATLSDNAVSTNKIVDDAVIYSKIQDVSAASRLLGRGSASGSGNVEEITISTGLTMSGTALSSTVVAPVWVLKFSQALSGANSYSLNGLGTPSDIMVLIVGATFGSSDRPVLRISVDNGSNYLSASGDYISFAGNGTPTNQTSLQFYDTSATASRGGAINISGCNVAAPKVTRSNIFSTDSINLRYIPNTSQINAVQVLSATANNFTGGTAYVYTR